MTLLTVNEAAWRDQPLMAQHITNHLDLRTSRHHTQRKDMAVPCSLSFQRYIYEFLRIQRIIWTMTADIDHFEEGHVYDFCSQ